MGISLVHLVLVLVGVLLGFLLLHYLKLVFRVSTSFVKVAAIAVVALVAVYALGIWRPDLSLLVRLISQVVDWFR
jgi:hypothetical protein